MASRHERDTNDALILGLEPVFAPENQPRLNWAHSILFVDNKHESILALLLVYHHVFEA